MFVYDVLAAIRKKQPFDEALFREKMTTFEWLWISQTECYDDQAKGDSITISQNLFNKYQASISNPTQNAGIRVANWRPNSISATNKTVTVDVSNQLKSNGTMALLFQYTRGGNAAVINDVELLQNGQKVSQDYHEGYTGYANKKNIFTLNLEKYNADANYQIRFKIRGDGGTNSQGDITLYQSK